MYQRPVEFYTQQSEAQAAASGGGRRRSAERGGVDFNNLILLTRGGKGYNRGHNNSVRKPPVCVFACVGMYAMDVWYRSVLVF